MNIDKNLDGNIEHYIDNNINKNIFKNINKNIYELILKEPLDYIYTGKFKAPKKDWIHERFTLKDYELFVVTEGTLYIADNNGKYVVEKGKHLLLAPTPGNMRYGYLPSECSFYWLHFMPKHELIVSDSSNSFTPDFKRIYIPAIGTLPAIEKVVILMKQLQDSLRSNYESNFINYITTTILCEIYNQYYSQKALSIKEPQRQIYNDIIDYIKLTITKNLKISEIAKHFGYNEKYLSHLFRNIEGLPMKQYILREKIELAKYRLSDTNDTINEIALSLGFIDSHNFMKTFKKTVGFTPTEYRNTYSKRLLYDK